MLSRRYLGSDAALQGQLLVKPDVLRPSRSRGAEPEGAGASGFFQGLTEFPFISLKPFPNAMDPVVAI